MHRAPGPSDRLDDKRRQTKGRAGPANSPEGRARSVPAAREVLRCGNPGDFALDG